MASAKDWLRRLLHRATEDTSRALKPRGVPVVEGSAAYSWVVLESLPSTTLGAMYADLLRQAAIPVMLREWGAGSAVLGGVPVGVDVLVPHDHIAMARDVLGREAEENPDER